MYSITIEVPRSVTARETLIWSDSTESDGTKATNIELELGANFAGSLKITIPYDNVGYSIIEHLTTIFRVYKKNTNGIMTEIWRGRVTSEEKDYNNSRVLFVEGELAYLNDTIVAPAEFVNFSISDFLEEILDRHNTNVLPEKRFSLGNVTVTTGNTSMGYLAVGYESTWECIKNNLLSVYGGVLKIRHSNGTRYLDYLKVTPLRPAISQQITFGNNLMDITKYWDVTDFATVIIPLGKKLDTPSIENNVVYDPGSVDNMIYKDPETTTEVKYAEFGDIFGNNPTLVIGNKRYRKILNYKKSTEVMPIATGTIMYVGNNSASSNVQLVKRGLLDDEYPDIERYVTIEAETGGSIYLVNQTAVNTYGRIEKVVMFDQAEDAMILKSLADQYMTSMQFDGMTLELEAVDLHYFDISIDDIEILDTIHVSSIPHQLDKDFMVTELSVRLDDPGSSRIKLAGAVEGVKAQVSDILGYGLIGTAVSRPVKTLIDAGAATRPRN